MFGSWMKTVIVPRHRLKSKPLYLNFIIDVQNIQAPALPPLVHEVQYDSAGASRLVCTAQLLTKLCVEQIYTRSTSSYWL